MRRFIQSIGIAGKNEEGQTLTEYGLLLFFIAVAAIASVTLLGENVAAFFQNLAGQLAGL